MNFIVKNSVMIGILGLVALVLGFRSVDAQTYTYVTYTTTGSSVSSSGIPDVSTFPNMTVGSRGSEVYDLQSILAELGYKAPTMLPTTYFGPITKAAVTSYQRAFSLPTTGYFGPMTRSSLSSYVSSLLSRVSAVSVNYRPTNPTGGTTVSTVSTSVSSNNSGVSASMLSPLRPTGYWYNGNWYNSVPAPGTPNVIGYWLNGTWTPLPNVSASVAQNVAMSTTSQSYGISTSNWRPY